MHTAVEMHDTDDSRVAEPAGFGSDISRHTCPSHRSATARSVPVASGRNPTLTHDERDGQETESNRAVETFGTGISCGREKVGVATAEGGENIAATTKEAAATERTRISGPPRRPRAPSVLHGGRPPLAASILLVPMTHGKVLHNGVSDSPCSRTFR
jgi:hypothetical protein